RVGAAPLSRRPPPLISLTEVAPLLGNQDPGLPARAPRVPEQPVRAPQAQAPQVREPVAVLQARAPGSGRPGSGPGPAGCPQACSAPAGAPSSARIRRTRATGSPPPACPPAPSA